jgi:hypothetical protein
MNKIILGVICMLCFITSCSDFLNEYPKTEMSVDQFFAAPDHARSAVNNLYRTGVPNFNEAWSAHAGATIMNNGYLSGFFDNEFKGQEKVVQLSQTLFLDPQNISGSLDGMWDGCYRAISRANTALKYIATTPGLALDEIAQLEAQAKFFRAYNYFYLVKAFGDVPLILEPYESLENLYVSRTASKDVYNQIIKDLTSAVAKGLNNESFVNNGFRITKGAAETLLADVYLNFSGYPLNEDNYVNAASAARSVINAGKHTLIENGDTPETSAYNIIRTSDRESEYIYSYEFEGSTSNGGWWATYCFPNKIAALAPFRYAITNNAYRPVKEILNVYDTIQDLRIQEKQFTHSSLTYIKDGETKTETFDVSPYIWYDEESMFETGMSGSSKDRTIYRYAEVLLIAAEAIAASEGVTSEAVKYLAEVRARAYTNTTQAAIESQLSSLSKKEFIEEVWTERIREFIFENKIWGDIQRTRMYPTTSDTKKGEVEYINVIGATNPWGAIFAEKHLLWPISANEIQRNPSLTQNKY